MHFVDFKSAGSVNQDHLEAAAGLVLAFFRDIVHTVHKRTACSGACAALCCCNASEHLYCAQHSCVLMHTDS